MGEFLAQIRTPEKSEARRRGSDQCAGPPRAAEPFLTPFLSPNGTDCTARKASALLGAPLFSGWVGRRQEKQFFDCFFGETLGSAGKFILKELPVVNCPVSESPSIT